MDFSSTPTPPSRRRGGAVSGIVGDVKKNLLGNKKATAIVAIGLFMFYWYEMRPMNINNECTVQAKYNSRELLKSKAEVATDEDRKASYMDLIKKDMYLRSDYEAYYKKCLRSYGIFI